VRYFPGRIRGELDLASLYRVCPHCLGDLVPSSDLGGDYVACLQCKIRSEPRRRAAVLPGILPELEHVITPRSDAYPIEVLTG